MSETAGSVPSAEFAIEVELDIRADNMTVRIDGLNGFQVVSLQDGRIKYPSGVFAGRIVQGDVVPKLISLYAERDFWRFNRHIPSADMKANTYGVKSRSASLNLLGHATRGMSSSTSLDVG